MRARFIATLIAALAGYAIAGPVGLVIGLLAGGAVDALAADLSPVEEAPKLTPQEEERLRQSGALLALAVAHADGGLSPFARVAIGSLYQVPSSLPADHGGLRRALDPQNEGEAAAARRIGRLLRQRPGPLEAELDRLIRAALSDGPITPRQVVLLRQAARIWGFSAAAFGRILRSRAGVTAGTPYGVLGIPSDAPVAEVKKAWRDLVRRHHPDRLSARGASPAELELAQARIAVINDAFRAIMAARRLDGPALEQA